MVSSTLNEVSKVFGEIVRKKNIHSECARRHRHSPQQSRPNTLPVTSKSFRRIGLLKAVSHAVELLLCTESITLHLTLDNIERVTAQPERLTRQTTVGSNLQARDILPLDVVAPGILVHEELKRQEPHTVGLNFTEIGNRLASVESPQHTLMGREFANAVKRAAVQSVCAMGLRLHTDTDMLNGSGEDRVGDTGKSTGHVVLAVGEGRVSVFLLVECL